MNDQELDRRLAVGDPARSTPAALEAVIDELSGRPIPRPHHHGRRTAAVVGVTVLMVGGLAAFTDLDTYMLSMPPFSTLDQGTVRTVDGLPYVPVGETDRGEQCAIWVDFGGLTGEELQSINTYWSSADPDAFAAGVNARLGAGPVTDLAESAANQEQLLEDFGNFVPGLTWGSATPDEPWTEGEPHLTSFSTTCVDDIEAIRG